MVFKKPVTSFDAYGVNMINGNMVVAWKWELNDESFD
jgi:hypothetical protein